MLGCGYGTLPACQLQLSLDRESASNIWISWQWQVRYLADHQPWKQNWHYSHCVPYSDNPPSEISQGCSWSRVFPFGAWAYLVDQDSLVILLAKLLVLVYYVYSIDHSEAFVANNYEHASMYFQSSVTASNSDVPDVLLSSDAQR